MLLRRLQHWTLVIPDETAAPKSNTLNVEVRQNLCVSHAVALLPGSNATVFYCILVDCCDIVCCLPLSLKVVFFHA